MYEAMKQTIDDSYIKMNQMGYEINNLNNIIYKSNLIISDLKNKLYKSLKPDILRVHFLTEDKIRRCLFYNTVKVNNEQQSANAIIFSNFIVRKISLYKLDKRYLCAEDLLKIDIIFADGTEKKVIISTKDIDKCKVIHKLSQQGVGIILKEKECVMETVFLQYINSLMNDIEVFVIPYTSGWIKNSDDKYKYQWGCCNPFDISSPYFDNVLKVSNKYDLYSSIKLSLKLYSEYFLDENIRLMVLAVSIYSLMRTIYSDKYNLQLNKLILLKSLSMNTKLVKMTADLFFNLFNEKRSFLEQSKKEFEKMVISSKDSIILLNVSNR